jgi:hypothetical protein
MKKLNILTAAAAIVIGGVCFAAQPSNPIEVGQVSWNRDLAAAFRKSATTKKPVLILFQEVPGCVGCRQFGKDVLSHPPLVEAMETEFVPVLVHNNKGGKDTEILKRFGEPAWNYQVIRFLNAEGQDIIPRKDRIWDIHGVAGRMIKTLEQSRRPVPGYLQAIAAESKDTAQLKLAGFAMNCFWTGEMRLGQIDGVMRTEAGWFDGREITLVRFDPAVISFTQLSDQAAEIDCAHKVYVTAEADLAVARKSGWFTVGKLDSTYRSAAQSDQKKQLQSTPFAKLDLSPVQRTKVNAWVRTEPGKALDWLTPSQRSRLRPTGN